MQYLCRPQGDDRVGDGGDSVEPAKPAGNLVGEVRAFGIVALGIALTVGKRVRFSMWSSARRAWTMARTSARPANCLCW